ncbi:MAG: hypothetical protein ABIG95_07170 [Candidatus Woesearchaeota archaeon]
MNKKGFVFSLMSILLLMTLFNYVTLYRQSLKQQAVDIPYAAKIRQLEEDLASDYFPLNGMTFEKTGQQIKISNFTFANTQPKITAYTAFLQNYSNLTNIPFTVSLTRQFKIQGINVTFNSTHIIISDISNLTQVSVDLTCLSADSLNTTGSPANSGTEVNVHAVMRKSTGAIALDSTRNLDKDTANTAFYARSATQGMRVIIGNSQLTIKTVLPTRLNNLTLTYNYQPTITVGTLDISDYNGFSRHCQIAI